MKKKHRDITVDKVTYGWIAEAHSITGMVELRVYKDKKVWFKTNFLGVVKPADVRNHIIVKLKTTTTDTTNFAVKSTNPAPSEWKKVK